MAMKTGRRFLVLAMNLGVLCSGMLFILLTVSAQATAVGEQKSRMAAQIWVKPPKPTKKPPKPTKTPTATPTLDLVLPTLTITLTLLPPLPTFAVPTATSTTTATETPTVTETPTATTLPTFTPNATPTLTPSATATSVNTPTATQPPLPTPSLPATPTLVAVQLQLTKTDLLSNDADTDNLVSPGDTLLYVIVASNPGAVAVQQLYLLDTLDANTTLVVGSVQTDLGMVRQGNNPGDSMVAVDLGALAPGASTTISLQATINSRPGATQLQNQAHATFANPASSPGGQTVIRSDDPDTDAYADVTITSLNANLPESAQQLFLPIAVR